LCLHKNTTDKELKQQNNHSNDIHAHFVADTCGLEVIQHLKAFSIANKHAFNF